MSPAAMRQHRALRVERRGPPRPDRKAVAPAAAAARLTLYPYPASGTAPSWTRRRRRPGAFR